MVNYQNLTCKLAGTKVQVPTIALIEPGNGVTDAVWQLALGLVRGGGVKRARSAALGPRSSDGLVEARSIISSL